jgi:hypothetical protein
LPLEPLRGQLAAYFRSRAALAAPLDGLLLWVRERSTHPALRAASDAGLLEALDRLAAAGEIMLEDGVVHNLSA